MFAFARLCIWTMRKSRVCSLSYRVEAWLHVQKDEGGFQHCPRFLFGCVWKCRCCMLMVYLWLGIVLKILILFDTDLSDLHRIQKANLTKDFQARLCYRSKYFFTFVSKNTIFMIPVNLQVAQKLVCFFKKNSILLFRCKEVILELAYKVTFLRSILNILCFY